MFARAGLAAALASALLATAAADYAYPNVPGAFPGYDLIINEEFTGPALNSSIWTPDWDCSGWGNGMRAAYTSHPSNLYINDSMLHLNPICGRLQPNKSICQPFTGYPECACEPTNVNNMDATSAQITSRHKFAFNKGKFRVRAKMSTGFYTWPAFWLYKNWDHTKGEVMPISGEIDIMEGVGKRPQWWTAVIHYLVRDPATGEVRDRVRNENADWSSNLNDSFHVYGLDWTDGFLVWSIDETVMWRLNYGRLFSDPNNINVFDDGLYYILLDVAVGGRMFGIGYGNRRPPYDELCADKDIFSPTQIDWVRLYQETGKHNYSFFQPGPDIVRGSSHPQGINPAGATCPFDGCVGSSWNDRVASIEAATRTPTAVPTTRPAAAATSGAAAATSAPAEPPANTSRPSGAAGLAASAAAVLLALVAGLFAAL
ncbi:concanavalin A-like lectin/glucanase domain-containing protein [Hyaloraphidium curvatum]|nr:concanavalin A-like lectin/glucanase domain-containing protein [Hyaloraphidium curvatum]